MTEKNNQTPELSAFLTTVKETQQIWALQEPVSGDWVIVSSVDFEDTDVMPLWSSEEQAKLQCTEEWKDYAPAVILLQDWFEFWIEDLAEDGVMIGINWHDEASYQEIDLADFSQQLADVEVLK
ncbi:DUF2750 domain-containing protein [Flocculibacter collagenilyticus]|uniref:DUF2750 domain-containing protein n=1 Tax=Flocculibacter collagenilyticus TaxID=2744479 RepID=UPI0018F72B40|nr:DUF2750 domain-containing protein [Flocculibacter collagenilyticus]